MTLHYEFPQNITLDEVKELIKDNDAFYMVDKEGGYTVVNYLRSGNDVFPPVVDRNTAILRELRGLIFDTETGVVISRPFHKFFNLGEREDIATLDISKPHIFPTKLDGSFIRPIRMKDGNIRWATKMGITDVSMQAEEYIASHPEKRYEELANQLLTDNYTPIFEWCSRKNRIVIDYAEDNLILLNIRNNNNGEYIHPKHREILREYFEKYYYIDMVSDININNFLHNEFIDHIREREDIEGVVILFDDGHMVKVKADTYVSLHRAKSLLDNERDVLELILEDKVDDLLPLLNVDDHRRLLKYYDDVWFDINCFANNIDQQLYHFQEELKMDRKTFAIKNRLNPTVQSFCFKFWDHGKNVNVAVIRTAVIDFIKKHIGSARSFEKVKNILLTASWKYDNYTE